MGDRASVNMTLSSNINNGSYLTCDYQDDSVAVQCVKITAFVIILLLSLTGNTLIIIIVYKRPELKKTINYFIVNMAVSDFAFPLTAIPVNIMEMASNSLHWPFDGTTGLILCKMKWYLQSVSITVSVQSLVWMAFDRFMAVVFPMKLRLFSSRCRAFALASTWVVAMIANVYHLYVHELEEQNEEILCTNFRNTSFIYMTFSKVYTVLFQIGPLIAMTVLYSAIAVKLKRQHKALRSQLLQQAEQRKRRAIKMAFCIMAAFGVCVLPMITYFVLWEYEIAMSCSLSRVLLFFAALLLYLSSAINPVICMSFVESYRHGLRDIFRLCCYTCCSKRHVEIGVQEEINLQRL